MAIYKFTMVKMPLWLALAMLGALMVVYAKMPDNHVCPEQVEIRELDVQRLIRCSGGSVKELQYYIRGAGVDISADNSFGPLTLAGWMMTKDGVILYEETK